MDRGADAGVGLAPRNQWCDIKRMMFVIKAEVSDVRARVFTFSAPKTMIAPTR